MTHSSPGCSARSCSTSSPRARRPPPWPRTTSASSVSDGPGLLGEVLARGRVREATTDRAWLQAMLDAEAGLARAQAAAGLIAPEHAEAIASACQTERYDVDALGAQAAAVGNPAAPLVRALRAEVGEPAAADVHRGATSQDIVDSATMLVARRALDALLDDLGGATEAAARLADEHRATVMAGRPPPPPAGAPTLRREAGGRVPRAGRGAPRPPAP